MRKINSLFPYEEFQKIHSCPKCGSHNIDMWCNPVDVNTFEQPTSVFCYDCGAQIAFYPTPRCARIVWNANCPGHIIDGSEERAAVLRQFKELHDGSYEDVIDAVEWENKKRPLALNSLEAGELV